MIFAVIFIIAVLVGLAFRRATQVVSFLSALGSLVLIAETLRGFTASYTLFGISLTFGTDNLSRFFAVLVGVGGFAVSIYSLGYMKPKHLVSAVYPSFLLSMALITLSTDFLGFFIFWELMTLASYVLIVAEYEEVATRKAGLLYFVVMHLFNTMPLALAFGYTYYVAGTLSFDQLQNLAPPPWVLGLIFIGFVAKAGIFPIHFWLPEAHPVAPSNVSALLSGVMLKMAVYGMLRSVLLFNFDTNYLGTVMVVLSALTIIVGSLFAIVQRNIKRMMAYSSIDNLGYIFLSIGAYILLNGDLKYFALVAALLHSFNHMLVKCMLFMLSGNIAKATERIDLEIRGLGKDMPISKALSLLGILSISGIPPTNGFISKLLIYIVTLSSDNPVLVISGSIALFGSALTLAAYLGFYRIYCGEQNANAREASPFMLLGEAILSSLCIIFALFPNAVLSIGGVELNLPLYSPVMVSGLAILLGTMAFIILHSRGEKTEPWTTGEEVPLERFEQRPWHMFEPLSLVAKLFQRISSKMMKMLERVKDIYYSHELGYIDEAIFLPPLRFIVGMVKFMGELGKSVNSMLAVSFLVLVSIAMIFMILVGVL